MSKASKYSKTNLREVDPSKYPALSNYTKAEIWREIGPGGLYLVSLLAEELELKSGSWVLDLGCGSAESSIYLANNYKVKVVAVDLWNDSASNARKIENRGQRGKIIPLKEASRAHIEIIESKAKGKMVLEITKS